MRMRMRMITENLCMLFKLLVLLRAEQYRLCYTLSQKFEGIHWLPVGRNHRRTAWRDQQPSRQEIRIDYEDDEGYIGKDKGSVGWGNLPHWWLFGVLFLLMLSLPWQGVECRVPRFLLQAHPAILDCVLRRVSWVQFQKTKWNRSQQGIHKLR